MKNFFRNVSRSNWVQRAVGFLAAEFLRLVWLTNRFSFDPPNLYEKPTPPSEEYSYLLVDVEPGRSTKFTLNRFRPWSSKPFESVKLWRDAE